MNDNKEYFLTFDGGGNKLKVIVYDSELNILGRAKSGGVNGLAFTDEEVRAHMKEAVTEVMKQAGSPKLSEASGVLIGSSNFMKEELNAHGCDEVRFLGEGHGCLLSALLDTRGAVALSGTGATMYYITPEREVTRGGFGARIGDEGSGYYIGEHGIRAGIRMLDGWGEETMLGQLLREYTHSVPGKGHNIFGYFYTKEDPTPMHMKIASFTHCVEKACNAGDRIALEIVRDAGSKIAMQMLSLLSQVNAPDDIGIAMCGGAWKTSPEMERVFREVMASERPNNKIYRPLLEPVTAGAVDMLSRRGRLEAERDKLLEKFKNM